MVTIIKYNRSKIYREIYIKVFSSVTVSCLTFSSDDVLNTTNNKSSYTEPRIFFEEAFEIKVQEGYVLKYLHFRIFQYPLDFSAYQTDNIMELVN